MYAGEGERMGACKAAFEIIVPIVVTAYFLNTVAYFPLLTLVPHIFVQGKGYGRCWEND